MQKHSAWFSWRVTCLPCPRGWHVVAGRHVGCFWWWFGRRHRYTLAACDGVDVVLVDARRMQRCVRSLCEEERAREPRHVAALVVHIVVALAGWRTWRPAPGGAVHPMVRRAEVISLCCLAKLELIKFFLCVGILFLFSVAGEVPARSGCAVCAPWCSPWFVLLGIGLVGAGVGRAVVAVAVRVELGGNGLVVPVRAGVGGLVHALLPLTMSPAG